MICINTPNELKHHGILGQKWGVRRYQNEDGTLTEEGRKRQNNKRRVRNASNTKNDVDSIISSMNKHDLELLNINDPSEEYLSIEQGEYIVKRFIEKEGDTPVAFFDILEDGDSIQAVIGTRDGDAYRNKGYASAAVKKGCDWVERNKDKLNYTKFVWGVRKDNSASKHLAEKYGFILDKTSVKPDDQWIKYYKYMKK